jgi:hypothetical protein
MNYFRKINTPVYLEFFFEFLDTGITEQKSTKYYQIFEIPESFDASPPT